MRFTILSLLLIAQTITASPFVVQLKESTTLSQFLDQDDLITTSSHVRPQVQQTIKIGDSFQAFVGDLNNDIIERLKKSPMVHDIMPNLQFTIFNNTIKLNQTKVAKLKKIKADGDSEDDDDDTDEMEDGFKIQKNAPRHLARLSSREGLYDQKEPFTYKYDFSGKDVVAYVIDTGIDFEHPEFQSRAFKGGNFVNETDGDKNGHGTHVAGIIGSKTYGVAKDVKLVEVKVLNKNGQGDLISILKGIEYAANDRKEKNVKGVANMSLGSVYIGIMNDAVNAAFKSGLVVVSAAGNFNSHASLFSPSSAEHSITVGALDDKTDTIAVFSNFGSKVNVFASGVEVESLNIHDRKGSVAYSGTSMASPVVAGLAAGFLEKGVSPSEIPDKIIQLSTEGIITKSKLSSWKYKTTPNRIAFNGVGEKEDISGVKKQYKESPYEQDHALLRYVSDISSIEPKDKLSIDLIERSGQIHGVKF